MLINNFTFQIFICSKNSTADSGVVIDANKPSTSSNATLSDGDNEPNTSIAYNSEFQTQENANDSQLLGTLMKLIKRCNKS